MREHQIVITLKPEQFLEIQRLARQANAKSMGIFVRQKLLVALGIESSSSNENKDNSTSADIRAAVQELKQLHTELKSFVAQSLSMYDTQQNISSQPLISPTHSIDDLEELAEQTFAISPRLGAIDSVSRDPLNEILDGEHEESDLEQIANQDMEEDEFIIPLAIKQRRQELAEQANTADDDNKIEEDEVSQLVEQEELDTQDNTKPSSSSQAADLDKSEVISPNQTKSENSHDNKSSKRNFSGGPPPKKHS